MEFQVLSHASMVVRSRGKTLLTDPWLLGSCYWRSWWNYPPVDPALIENLVPDAIYLTHVHWDHFHGATLKKFSRDTLIVIPYERSPRVYRDLRKMGYANIWQLPHACGFNLEDEFRITSYQFASPWGDSALVIEADGVKLLNANDCKIMGGPLNQILKRHGSFDFAFRSHSSANDRLCYEIIDSEEQPQPEDPAIYAQSFLHFMNKVKPKYAIPFASNHCHLHRDVYHLNQLITTPVQVVEYVEAQGGLRASELKVMVSGDSWDSEHGFNITPQTYFTNRDEHLKRYVEANVDKLEASYQLEEKVDIRLNEFERFFSKFCKAVPLYYRRALRGKPIVFVAVAGERRNHFLVDVYGSKVTKIQRDEIPANAMFFEAPAIVLKKALAANMFSHVGISKRVKYRMHSEDRMHMVLFNQLLAAYEYDVLPLSELFSLRTLRSYARRWRELILYARLLYGKRAGKSSHQLEAEILTH